MLFVVNGMMDRESHLEFLRQKYLQLSREYIRALQQGKTPHELKDVGEVIRLLIDEMEALEKDVSTGKQEDSEVSETGT